MQFREGMRVARRVAGVVVFVLAAGWSSVATRAEAAPLGVRILYAEPLRIAVPAGTDSQQKAAGELRKLQFTAYGRAYTLSIDANDTFHDGAELKASRSSLKLYRGAIDGLNGSWVRLATKGHEVHGMLWDGSHIYVVAPSSQVQEQLVSPEQGGNASVIFRLSDVLIDSRAVSCAADGLPQTHKASEAYDALLNEISRVESKGALGASMRLELSALGDSPYLERYASEQEARDAILLRLNNVDGIFSSQLGVEIQVPTVHIHSHDSDPLSSVAEAGDLLEELARVRSKSPELRSRGLTHLFTGRDLEGTTIGIAYVDALCQARDGVGLTETSGNRGTWYESLVAAHEIGHNFGAVHDGGDNVCRDTPKDLFLMSPTVSGADTFSQCSLQRMRPKIDRARCIASLPPANVSIPSDLGAISRAVGTTFDWDLSVTNTGGTSAREVRSEVRVAPALAVEDAYVTGGSCTSGAGIVQCQLGDLAGGTSRAIHLRLRSDAIGTNSISAHVFSQNATDADGKDNAGEGTVVIEPEADVSVSVEGPAQAQEMDTFALDFTVANGAVIEALGLSTIIELPEGFTAESPTQEGATCTIQSGAVMCTLPSLAPGASSAGTVRLLPSRSGTVILRAEVSGSYVDPDSSNDAAEASVEITALSPPGEIQATSSSSGSPGGGGGGGSSNALWLICLGSLLFGRRAGFLHA